MKCPYCGNELSENGSDWDCDGMYYYEYDLFACEECGKNFFIRKRFDLVFAGEDDLEEM